MTNPNLSTEIGIKFDFGKLKFSLLPIDSVYRIVEVLNYGAKKYSDDNWKKVEPIRYYNSMMRHLFAHLQGEEKDDDSGFNHLTMFLVNALIYENLTINNKPIVKEPIEDIIDMALKEVGNKIQEKSIHKPDPNADIPTIDPNMYKYEVDPYNLTTETWGNMSKPTMETNYNS